MPTDRLPSLSRTRTLPGGDFASCQSPLIHVSWMYVLLLDPPAAYVKPAPRSVYGRGIDKASKSLSDFSLGRAKKIIRDSRKFRRSVYI